MAELIPSLEKINNMKPKPTEGEYTLIKKLSEELGDDYKVYYQPFLDGDRPDIIVLKKNLGILIIEVKDWNLNSYNIGIEQNSINNYRKKLIFRLKKNNAVVGNPFEQVNRYKSDFYGPYIEGLFMDLTRDSSIYRNLVRTAVYFHNEKDISVKRFGEFGKIIDTVKYTRTWGRDSNIIEDVEYLFSYNFYKNRKIEKTENFKKLAKLYNDEFERLLQPAFHEIDEGEYVKFIKKQEALAKSKENEQKKIKGVAGSGKTLLLAHRAVSAAKRTDNTVLILTYNITISNYIRDRLNKVRENFSWDKFEIKNYHLFIKKQLDKCKAFDVDLFDDDDKEQNELLEKEIKEIFERNRDKLKKYKAIFVDECQDFDKIWLDTIKENFLAPDGEFVIFADEKQNIYGRDLDKDKKVKTNIVGKWNELNQSFRVKNRISKLAELYQKEFMNGKYELDKFESEQIGFGDNSGEVMYNYSEKISIEEIREKVEEIILKKKIHNNKVCILGMQVVHLRLLEKYFRDKYDVKFEMDIETEEEYQEIYKKYYYDKKELKKKLEARRRIRKRHFYLDSGKMKISTTHSFKGWELENIVLIIDSDDGNTTDELIYTAFTRAKENLIIFNRGNRKIDKFFNEKVDYTPI